jgi:hypothetical protein
VRKDEQYSNDSIDSLEARLCREFGRELKSRLRNHFREALEGLESNSLRRELRELERFSFLSEKESRGFQAAEIYATLMEQRAELLRSTPELQRAHSRLVAASQVVFAARIAGYSSLLLDLSVGSVKQLSQAFDSDFDSFRVFLDAFVPVAFGDVFSESVADQFKFNLEVPGGFTQTFDEVSSAPVVAYSQPPATEGTATFATRERAEWLWKLANGSLLVPFILALVVLYFGFRTLADIHSQQRGAIQPILEHYLALLREDRLRMSQPTKESGDPTQKQGSDKEAGLQAGGN